LQWAEITPAFIPSFKRYQPSGSRFRIKKVLKQEKTGFLLIFLMYFLFDEIGADIIRNKITIIFDFWFYAMIAAMIVYAIIKLLQKKTSIIN
jgi:hypothetical protein